MAEKTLGTLRVVEGDVTDPQITNEGEIVLIPHCCNNQNGWGAGFVLALNRKWKEPEQRYRDFCRINDGIPILGEVCYAKIDNHLVIANMIGQDGTVSTDNPKPIKYVALAKCMGKVVEYIELMQCRTSDKVVIHTPKFGSELAGGNFSFILELIEEIWIEAGIDVVIYEYV